MFIQLCVKAISDITLMFDNSLGDVCVSQLCNLSISKTLSKVSEEDTLSLQLYLVATMFILQLRAICSSNLCSLATVGPCVGGIVMFLLRNENLQGGNWDGLVPCLICR